MDRPFQFPLRTIFWVIALASLLCAAAPIASQRYREYEIASIRAQIDECRREMQTPSDCGVAQVSLQLELRELEKTLADLESR